MLAGSDLTGLSQRYRAPVARAGGTSLLVALAGGTFVAHLLVAGNDGYFRDELYYLADGRHLQAGYVDQPLLMGWLAALLRVTVGTGLLAIHVIPALAAALIVVATGLLARELGGGRVAQLVAGVAALFCLDFLATGSLFSMDVLDQLWWTLMALLVAIRLHRDLPRLWLLVGVVTALALLTKLTVLFSGLALVLALLISPERHDLRAPWVWLGGAVAFLGLLPYLIRNALNGWPTVEFWRHYGGVGTGPLAFLGGQAGQMNPLAVPLALAGLAFYFRPAGVRQRLPGWAFVSVTLVLTVIGTKAYFLAPAYPILFAAGAVAFERWRPRPRLTWLRPAYVALLVLSGLLLAPDVMPILPPATVAQVYGSVQPVLGDRLGWERLTETVEEVDAGLPPAQRAQACVLASNYGEAGALQLLAPPGTLPPVISGHNNYFLWGPGACTGAVLIVVGYSASDLQAASALYADVTLAATQRCQYCVIYEQNVPIYVLAEPRSAPFPSMWASLKHYD
jgi:4-amino-4-deoxy-L-arabinose transferase-like glycosyltransferase